MVGTGEDTLSALGGSRGSTKDVSLNGVIRAEGGFTSGQERAGHIARERGRAQGK